MQCNIIICGLFWFGLFVGWTWNTQTFKIFQECLSATSCSIRFALRVVRSSPRHAAASRRFRSEILWELGLLSTTVGKRRMFSHHTVTTWQKPQAALQSRSFEDHDDRPSESPPCLVSWEQSCTPAWWSSDTMPRRGAHGATALAIECKKCVWYTSFPAILFFAIGVWCVPRLAVGYAKSEMCSFALFCCHNGRMWQRSFAIPTSRRQNCSVPKDQFLRCTFSAQEHLAKHVETLPRSLMEANWMPSFGDVCLLVGAGNLLPEIFMSFTLLFTKLPYQPVSYCINAFFVGGW